jgi:hypothetical protein
MVLDRRHEDWHPTNPSSTSRTSQDTKRNTLLPLWRFATETTGSHSREWSTARDNGSRLVLYRCWAGLRLATRQSLPCVSPPPLAVRRVDPRVTPPPPLVRKQQSLRASPALVGTSAIGPHVSERSEWDANRLDITLYCPSCSSDVQRVRLSRRSCMMRVESL